MLLQNMYDILILSRFDSQLQPRMKAFGSVQLAALCMSLLGYGHLINGRQINLTCRLSGLAESSWPGQWVSELLRLFDAIHPLEGLQAETTYHAHGLICRLLCF